MSFTSKFSSENKKYAAREHSLGKAVIFEITGQANGKPAWYLLKVFREKQAELKRKLAASDAMELTEYGEVLASGWGESPDADQREAILKQHGP